MDIHATFQVSYVIVNDRDALFINTSLHDKL